MKYKAIGFEGEEAEGFIVAKSEGCVYIGELTFLEFNSEAIECGVEYRGCSDIYEGAEYGYTLALEEMMQNIVACDPNTVELITND
jgi:hypothetical protein